MASFKEDYYEILGVSFTVGRHEMKIAYKKRALELHPDRNNIDTTEDFQKLRRAWKTLKNPERRNAYNNDVYKQLINCNAATGSGEKLIGELAANPDKTRKREENCEQEIKEKEIRAEYWQFGESNISPLDKDFLPEGLQKIKRIAREEERLQAAEDLRKRMREYVEIMEEWKVKNTAEKAAKAKKEADQAKAARACAISRATEVFRFVDLPPEIRDMIYRYSMRRRLQGRNGTRNQNKKPPLLRALQNNANLYEPAKKIYYQINSWRHSIMKDGTLKQMAPETMSLIQTITFVIPQNTPSVDSIQKFSPNIFHATNVTHLTLQPQGAEHMIGLDYLVQKYLPTLKKLKTIRLTMPLKHDYKIANCILDILRKVLGDFEEQKSKYLEEGGGDLWTFTAKGKAFEPKENKRHIKFE